MSRRAVTLRRLLLRRGRRHDHDDLSRYTINLVPVGNLGIDVLHPTTG